MMKIAVVGCGAAGYYAAKRLRAVLPDASVTLFEATGDPLYARMRLPEYVAGKLAREKLFLTTPERLASDGIDAHLDSNVVALRREDRILRLADGTEFSYDRLLLATGSNANLPSVPGLSGSPRVLTLRKLADADRLAQLASDSASALVIGGGLLGLEGACALRERGLAVTVLEFADRLLPRQLGEGASARLRQKFEDMGFRIVLSACSAACETTGKGVCLTLKDGRVFEAEMLLVSAGIVPEISLAKAAGLDCGRAICVNERLQTSDPAVYAAGDCAELAGRTVGLWLAARDQGEAAADIIAGRRAVFTSPEYHPKLKVSGIDFSEVMKED